MEFIYREKGRRENFNDQENMAAPLPLRGPPVWMMAVYMYLLPSAFWYPTLQYL